MKSKLANAEEKVEIAQVFILSNRSLKQFTKKSGWVKYDITRISLNKITGLTDLTVTVEVWLTEPVQYMLGLDDDNEWLQDAFERDRPVEFLPAGSISIYLDELSTTNNYQQTNQK